MEGLLGAYGSEDEEEMHEEEQQGGQVTLLRHDSGEGVDLSHLTNAAAAGPDGDGVAAGPAPGPQPAGGAAAAEEEQPGQPEGTETEGSGAAEEEAGDFLSRLPPELRQPPEGECDSAMQRRVANWLSLQRTGGKYINKELRKSRGYRNPEFFAKMVEHLEIDQYGTCFPPEVFDPHGLPPEDYLDALLKEQATEEERRKQQRAAGQGRVEFAKSTSQPSLAHNPLLPTLNPAAAVAAAQAQAARLAALHTGNKR